MNTQTPAPIAAHVAEMLKLPPKERILRMRQGCWILHPRAEDVMRDLEYVLAQPPRRRMIGMTIVGPSNNGKTTLVERFIAQNTSDLSVPDAEVHEFLRVEAPAQPSPTMFLTRVLHCAGDPRAHRGTLIEKTERALHLLPKVRLRLLFLDEIHNVLAGSAAQVASFLNTLKQLSNELQIPVVLIGTEQAVEVLARDRQLHSRYPPRHLPAWECDRNFVQLIKRLIAELPLRDPPKLSEVAVRRIHEAAVGATGAVVEILHRAAVAAIVSGRERIDDEGIEQALR